MMGLTWNWFAIALSLTAAAPTNGNPGAGMAELKSAVGKIRQFSGGRPEAPQISYRIRVVEMEGLGWREAWFARLTPVAQRGAATIWTAPQRASQAIVDGASKVIVSPPRVTSHANAAAHFNSRTNRSLVTRVSWSEGDANPAPETIREGFAATIAGRKLDQGVLVQVVIDDTEIRSVHQIKFASDERPKSGADAKPKVLKDVEGEPRILQIPEIASQEIVGEWLIPNDGVLVVGLGIHTAGGKDGKAVVRERLMLIEASDAAVLRTALRGEPTPGAAPLPSPPAEAAPAMPAPPRLPMPTPVAPSRPAVPAPVTPSPSADPNPMPTPTPPSRSLPQGVNADGTPAELPPLPEEADQPDPSDSAEPHGSPQGRPKAQPVPMPAPPKPDAKDKAIDAKASTASYSPGKAGASPLAFPLVQPAPGLPSKRVQWTPVNGRSFPASLDRWLESVRARGMSVKDGADEGCDDDSACEDECRDEE